MWVKVDDALPDHPKVLEAARHLGTYGAGRVLAIWTKGMCYCNHNLTDGFIPELVLRSWTIYDRRPLDVAFVMADAGLFIREERGFRFHDYVDYQPSAAEVKLKKKKDRDRKRKGKEIPSESEDIPLGIGAESNHPGPRPCLSISTHEKDHPGSRRVLTFATPEVLKALVWRETEAAFTEGEREIPDVTERVKQKAAHAGFDYSDHEIAAFLCEQVSLAVHRLKARSA